MRPPPYGGTRPDDVPSSLSRASVSAGTSRSRHVLHYPAHLAGAALFGLRCALGLTLVAESWRRMPPPLLDATAASAHLALMLCGLALVFGVLSPVCSIVVALRHAHVVTVAVPGTAPPDMWAPAVIAITAALTVAAVGPGAFSVDARLFGRHRIVILSRNRRE